MILASLYYWIVNSCFFDNIFSPQRCESAEICLFFSLLCVLCTPNSVEAHKKKPLRASAFSASLRCFFSSFGCGLTAALGLRGGFGLVRSRTIPDVVAGEHTLVSDGELALAHNRV